MDDAAIHRVWGTRAGLSVRLLRASGSPRPQGARDDKVEGAGRLVVHSGSPRACSPRDDKQLKITGFFEGRGGNRYRHLDDFHCYCNYDGRNA